MRCLTISLRESKKGTALARPVRSGFRSNFITLLPCSLHHILWPIQMLYFMIHFWIHCFMIQLCRTRYIKMAERCVDDTNGIFFRPFFSVVCFSFFLSFSSFENHLRSGQGCVPKAIAHMWTTLIEMTMIVQVGFPLSTGKPGWVGYLGPFKSTDLVGREFVWPSIVSATTEEQKHTVSPNSCINVRQNLHLCVCLSASKRWLIIIFHERPCAWTPCWKHLPKP